MPIRIATLIFFFLIQFLTQAQIPLGSWRMHPPYNNALSLGKIGNEIWVATFSGLFAYDTETGGIRLLNKVNGLSDIGISAFAIHPSENTWMVGYENGNLDLSINGTIYNLKDILNADLIGSRKINSIKFSGSFAYVACDFGMVVFNYKKREVRASNLRLGAGGTPVIVLDCAKFNDTIYALTRQGLKSVLFRQDFKNTDLWKSYGTEVGLPADNTILQTIDSIAGTVVVTTQNGIHPRKNKAFFRTSILSGTVRSVREGHGKLIVCIDNNVVEYNLGTDTLLGTLDSEYYKKISRPSDVYYDKENVRWVTDLDNALLRITGTDTTQILPNGPLFSGAFSLTSYKNKVMLHSGGYSYPTANFRNNNGGGFAVFEDNYWTTYNRYLTPALNGMNDFVRSFFNPIDQKLYLCSFNRGIAVRSEDQSYTILNDSTTNGGLCNLFAIGCIWNLPEDLNRAKDYVTTSSVTFDAGGDLWACNFEAPDGSLRRRSARDGSWTSFPLPLVNGKYALDVIADKSNFKWVRMAPGRDNGAAGIWILNGDGSKKVALNTQEGQGALPSSDVYDIKEDKSGYIWVGTGKGLAVFYNPYNAFFTGGITASTPIFPPEAGRPVLENDVVSAIEVDGANRKWVGTRESGLWLFNEDITKVIHHFTAENSPLISNQIYDIAINSNTGEVFIATDQGLVSYQSDATENMDNQGRFTTDQCNDEAVDVFPNPVRNNFDGLIAFRGLASNSEVKIITASGKLVYKTIAKGGMATWNGKTYEGNRAHPGIYLVLSATEDGKANCVTKLALLD